jgi:WD40 repeat protein
MAPPESDPAATHQPLGEEGDGSDAPELSDPDSTFVATPAARDTQGETLAEETLADSDAPEPSDPDSTFVATPPARDTQGETLTDETLAGGVNQDAELTQADLAALNTWEALLTAQGLEPGATFRTWAGAQPGPASPGAGTAPTVSVDGELSVAGKGVTLISGDDASWQWEEQTTVSNTPRRAEPDMSEIAAGEAFELQGELGRGGMGIVYRAYQPSLDREVAVKTLIPEKTTAGLKRRFVAEAQITARLGHPNVVAVHGLSRSAEGDLLLPMALVGGASWKDLLAEEPTLSQPARLSFEDHLRIFSTVCNAVAFAHSRGVLHLDLKPANVMVGDFEEVLLSDWGLAVHFGVEEAGIARHVSELRSPCGTPSYMAPELARGAGKEVGPWTDVYLLGGILCELIRGQPPHTGHSTRDVIGSAIEARVPDLSQGRGSRELKAICARALAKDVADRYADVGELIAALRLERGHRESVLLAEAAQERLEAQDPAQAPAERYRAYDEALAGFRQAAKLWSENTRARAGEVEARLAYAQAALGAGDLQLAEAQLKGLGASERVDQLTRDLAAAYASRAAQEAQAGRLRTTLLGSAALLFLGLVIGITLVANARERALEAKADSDRQRDLAVAAQRTAEQRRVEAQEAQERALEALAQTFEEQARAASAESNWGESALYAVEALEVQDSPTRKGLALEALGQTWATTVYDTDGAAPQSVAWGPRGERLAAACGEVVYVFRRDGERLRSLPGHRGARALAWLPDGLAVGCSDSVKVWNPDSGQELASFATGGSVQAILAASTGELAVWLPEGFGLWSLAGEERWQVKQSARDLRWVKGLLQVVDQTGQVSRFDPAGKIVSTTPGRAGRDYSLVRSSPDGRSVLTAMGASLEIWIEGQVQFNHGSLRNLASLAWAPDMSHAAAGGLNGSVLLIASDGRRTSTFGHRRAVRALDFAPSGWEFASGDDEGRVRVWDASLGDFIATFSLPGAVQVLEYRGKGILVGTQEGHLRLLERPSNYDYLRLLDTFSHGIERVEFSPFEVLASTGRRTVAAWVGFKQGLGAMPLFDSAKSTGPSAWSPDGVHLAAGLGGKLALFEGKDFPEDGQPRLRLEIDPLALAWSRDGSRLAALDRDRVVLLDPAAGKVLSRLPVAGESSRPYALSFSPSDEYLAYLRGSQLLLRKLGSGLGERILSREATCLAWGARGLVWGESDGALHSEQRGELGRLSGSVTALVVDRAGRFFAGSATGQVWSEGSEPLQIHEGAVEALTVHEGVVASGGSEGVASISREGQELLRFNHPGPVRSVDWSRSGELLATGCSDGMVRVLRLRDLQPEAKALAREVRRLTQAEIVGGVVRLKSQR